MIPKNVIELSLKGGWSPVFHAAVEFDFEMCGSGVEFSRKDTVYSYTVRYEKIALDPDFWMALGKVNMLDLKHDRWWVAAPCPDNRIGCIVSHYRPTWEDNALEFTRLILRKASQEELDDYWKSIV